MSTEAEKQVPPPASEESSTPSTPVQEGEPKKKGPTKEDKKKARLEARLAEEAAKAAAKAELLKQYIQTFGQAPLVRSETYNTKVYTELKALGPEHVGKTVLIRCRIHTARKQGSKMAFLVFRDVYETIQGVVAAAGGLPAEMVGFAASIPSESVVDVEATVATPENPTKTSKSNLELHLTKLHVVSEAANVLPFQYEDASRNPHSNPDGLATVAIDTRLNCRWMDLRTKASNAIFRLQSRVGQYYRQALLDRDFVEIHTPKMIGTASEGGANVFKLDYFGKPAFLAQSPQLYKQMALQGDLERVFEVAPVFRAENANTHRHMTEFIGLDMEMRINEHYHEVLNVAEEVFASIFRGLATCTKELEAINEQHPFEPMVFQMTEEKMKELGVGVLEENVESTDPHGGRIRNHDVRMLRIPYPEAIALLNTELEEKMSAEEDINTENERKLGAIVKKRYGVDFYIMDRYPSSARPFYTMPCPDDERFSNSYDMFIRGEEIVSGAQRIHDPAMLMEKAAAKGVDPRTIKDYVDSFRLGAWPHGGMGVGCERLVFLYLGLKNVRYASLFPRDPYRVSP